MRPGVYGLGWLWDSQLAALGLLLLAASGAAAVRDHLRFGSGANMGPLLAALALILWHLGFHTPGSSEKWCVAVVKAANGNSWTDPLKRDAAVGLVLFDDLVRAILRFVAGTPVEAWPFALTDRRGHHLWVRDEEWWEACYRDARWMRLPASPKSLGGAAPQAPQASWHRLVREAMLWVSMMAETLGMSVALRPRCAAPYWAAAPCVASTLLVVSCAPWLPRQSNMVLVEMLQLMRIVGRFAVYFQAVWIAVIGLLLQPEEVALCRLPTEHAALRLLEAGALGVLYVMVAGHLWAVTTRCRIASPLYAVPTEDVVSEPPLRSRTLYCGGLGMVEGSYAPTRMCDWEDGGARLAGSRWRDRYALRRCAELLASREAHVLSHLDALHLRVAEAEREAHGSARSGVLGPLRKLGGPCGFVVVALCMAAALGWRSSRCVPAALSSSMENGPGNVVEAALWASLLLRAGHGWYSIVLDSIAAWEAAGHAAYAEVVALQQQACMLHENLAEAQWMLRRLEAHVESSGIAVLQPRRDTGGGDGNAAGAARVLLLGCLSSICALVLLPHDL